MADASGNYTTPCLVRKRCKYISTDLLDADITEFILQAENLIDCVMRDSFVTDFDASHNAILRQCATDLAAYAATSYDPGHHPSPAAFGAMLENLWVEAERLLAYLEDKRTVDYLKSRG